MRKAFVWVKRGYADAREKEVYKRSPGPEPPDVPDKYLPNDWKKYFEGFKAGVQDNIRSILNKRGAKNENY